MIAVDLFQCREIVPSRPGRENADQQPDVQPESSGFFGYLQAS